MNHKNTHPHDHHISETWEEACIKSRRFIWLRRRRLSQFNLNRKSMVLDLGCGDGLNVWVLNSMKITNVVGLDMSKNLIKEAKKMNPNVKFYVGFMEKLPFKNNQFDAILVDSVFHHLMEYPQSIKEIKRVLKRDGLLCFVEPHQSPARRILDYISTLKIIKFIPVLNQRSIGYLGEKDLMRHWLTTEDEFLELLKEQGFKKVFLKKDVLSIVGEYKKS